MMSICDECTHEKVCGLKDKTQKVENRIPALSVPYGQDSTIKICNIDHLQVEVNCKFREEKTKPVNWRLKGRSVDFEEGVIK